MMSAKMTTSGLLKIKVFWNKDYDIISSVYDVTNKILSWGLTDIVEMAIWPDFGNSSISLRDVNITSILQRFTRKNTFLEKLVLVQV